MIIEIECLPFWLLVFVMFWTNSSIPIFHYPGVKLGSSDRVLDTKFVLWYDDKNPRTSVINITD